MLAMSQLRSRASALSCGIGGPGAARSSRSERVVGPLARMQAADQAAGLRSLVGEQHTADLAEQARLGSIGMASRRNSGQMFADR
jgi:hypothetical protein